MSRHRSILAIPLLAFTTARGATLPATTAPTPSTYWPAPMTTQPTITAPPPIGPFQPTWQSIRAHYQVPTWFIHDKFGIFIHWGLYAIPAYHNEWYSKHMYGAFAQWHTEHFGPPNIFGYKDFIPLFTASKYDPAKWADIFKNAGAKYVVMVAEHHDGFAMYDSDLTPWCAAKMGPKRDLLGDLAKAVRADGLIFGLSSHRMEHHTFMYPAKGVKSDEFDPRFRDFYGPPVPGSMNDANASPTFQHNWLLRCEELVNKYHPQLFYFDNGVNDRAYDPVKLQFAAYYYNRAFERHESVTISTKDDAYLAGSVRDFEKVGTRSPKTIDPTAWMVDDPLGNSWGYIHNETFTSSQAVLGKLIDVASKGGSLMLNVSPNADGVLVDPQPQRLAEIGRWLATNGQAINDTHPWKQYGEGPSLANLGNRPFKPGDYRFTAADDNTAIYAIAMTNPGPVATITTMAGTGAKEVRLLGTDSPLKFHQVQTGLHIEMPPQLPNEPYFVFKITGLEQK